MVPSLKIFQIIYKFRKLITVYVVGETAIKLLNRVQRRKPTKEE
jgi:hypothetical protein